MSCSVFVLPVPVAPATSPWRLSVAQRDAHGGVAVHRALVDPAAEVERGALGRVGGGDGLGEVGAHGAGRLPGRAGGS